LKSGGTTGGAGQLVSVIALGSPKGEVYCFGWRWKRPEPGVHRGGSYGGRRRMPALARRERRHKLNRQARRGGKEWVHAKVKQVSAWHGMGQGGDVRRHKCPMARGGAAGQRVKAERMAPA
jgi:hypothetical protein